MNWVNSDYFSIYFGSQEDNLRVEGNYDFEKFSLLQKKLQLENIFFLKQTHSTDVFTLNVMQEQPLNLFHYEGDAIITNIKNIGIGVVTADCLPVMLYDPIHHAIAAIHAGWKGLSTNIITATIKKMHAVFSTEASQLQVYFGPSAGVCCYEVQSDFLTYFSESVFEKNIIEKRDGRFYFNERLSGWFELLDNNVSQDNININNNSCTICQPGFCSARKQKENAGRQPSVVFLN